MKHVYREETLSGVWILFAHQENKNQQDKLYKSMLYV